MTDGPGPRRRADSRLVDTSPRLRGALQDLTFRLETGGGRLFERKVQRLDSEWASIGEPGRDEYVDRERSRRVLNLAAYGYLGLAKDGRVIAAAQDALARFGTQMGGPRVLCGTTELHARLEQQVAEFCGSEASMTYPSGYVANVSTIATLFGGRDVIIVDRLAHQSVYDGVRLSQAGLRRFRHNDIEHLEFVLRQTSAVRRRLVVVDGVYSMDGDVAPLPAIIDVVRRHDAFLLVDEAHSFGVMGERGRGLVEHFDLPPRAIDLRIGTLSKAIPSIGGFVAADAEIVRVLRYSAHATVFSASLPPADVAAALCALEILDREPERVARLHDNVRSFCEALSDKGMLVSPDWASAILPIRIGTAEGTLAAAERLLELGVYVAPILAPGVARGTERLRCCLSAAHDREDLRAAAEHIAFVVSAARQQKDATSGAS